MKSSATNKDIENNMLKLSKKIAKLFKNLIFY